MIHGDLTAEAAAVFPRYSAVGKAGLLPGAPWSPPFRIDEGGTHVLTTQGSKPGGIERDRRNDDRAGDDHEAMHSFHHLDLLPEWSTAVVRDLDSRRDCGLLRVTLPKTPSRDSPWTKRGDSRGRARDPAVLSVLESESEHSIQTRNKPVYLFRSATMVL